MATIKKAQRGMYLTESGDTLRGKAAAEARQREREFIKELEYMERRRKYKSSGIPSAGKIVGTIAGKTMKKGGKVAKKGGSFPDLNKDGKITKADILKGRGVIAKGGSKVKKAQMGKSIAGNVPKSVKVDTAGTIKKYGDAFKPKGSFKRGKNVVMKTGGKAPKKMMGGGRMKKCRGGCY
jgi:hypothetical protein